MEINSTPVTDVKPVERIVKVEYYHAIKKQYIVRSFKSSEIKYVARGGDPNRLMGAMEQIVLDYTARDLIGYVTTVSLNNGDLLYARNKLGDFAGCCVELHRRDDSYPYADGKYPNAPEITLQCLDYETHTFKPRKVRANGIRKISTNQVQFANIGDSPRMYSMAELGSAYDHKLTDETVMLGNKISEFLHLPVNLEIFATPCL